MSEVLSGSSGQENEVPITKESDEFMRFGSKPPLQTLFGLSFGPLLSQLTSSLYGLIDSMWISRVFGEIGLTATSASYVIDYSALAFGHFMTVASSSKVSYLYGKGDKATVSQVVVDLLRFTLIIGVLIPAALLPLSYPVFNWLGTSSNVSDMAFNYLLPLLICAVFTVLYYCLCGVLQGEGRTFLYGVFHVTSLVLNMCVLDPLFLLGFKTKIWGAAMATIISEFIPAIIIIVMLFKGKLTTKVHWRQFLKPFHSESFSALKVGLSSLISNISMTVPTIMLQKYMALSGEAIGKFDDVLAMWNVMVHVYQLCVCIVLAFNMCYLPAASFAYGRQMYSRIIKLTLHSLWITSLWAGLCSAFVCFFPRLVGRIWSDKEQFLDLLNDSLPIAFLTLFFCPSQYVAISFLQAFKKSLSASICSILTTLIPLPTFSTIMYYTNKTNPPRLFYAYVMNDIFSVFISLMFTWKQIHRLIIWAKDEASDERVYSDDDSDPVVEI